MSIAQPLLINILKSFQPRNAYVNIVEIHALKGYCLQNIQSIVC
jgi:hypothetical protein